MDVQLDKNFARFLIGNARGEDLKPLLVPLDWIHTVWRDDLYNEWQIVVDAVLSLEGDHWVPYQRVS